MLCRDLHLSEADHLCPAEECVFLRNMHLPSQGSGALDDDDDDDDDDDYGISGPRERHD